MADVKNYGISGVSADVELGKGGARLTNNSDVVEAKGTAGALTQVRGADPVGDSDFVTKKFLQTRANVFVTGQIDGNSPPSAATAGAGAIYVCTTTGGTYTVDLLYRSNGSTWEDIFSGSTPEGLDITVTDDLTSGTVEYQGDHRYVWDEDNTQWVDVGTAVSATTLQRTARLALAFDTTSPAAIVTVPDNSRPNRIVVNVTQVFDGTTPTLTIGDTSDPDRLATAVETDLTTAGIYVIDCYHNYATSTAVEAALTVSGASQGTAQIEVFYSIP